jgi:hypothetical protein
MVVVKVRPLVADIPSVHGVCQPRATKPERISVPIR